MTELLQDPRRGNQRRISEMAALLTVVHLFAVLGLRMGMSRGVAPASLLERHSWLAEFPAQWTLAWGAWILASFTFLGFFLFTLWELGSSTVTRAAAWLAAGATVVGLGSRVFLSGGLSLAATLEGAQTFQRIEALTWAVELVPVRVLQMAAIVALTVGLARAGIFDRRVVVLAALYAFAALAVCLSSRSAEPAWTLLVIVPETVLLIAWVLVAASQTRRARLGMLERSPAEGSRVQAGVGSGAAGD